MGGLRSWNDTPTTQAIVEFAETAARRLPPGSALREALAWAAEGTGPAS